MGKNKKMRFINPHKIIGEALHSFYEEETFELTKRLEEKNHVVPFKLLVNFDLVRTFAINSYKLTFDYIHLLEQEQFDEN